MLIADGCWERIFEVLFKGVSTRFGRRSFEKHFENVFPNVRSAIQNLRLGSIKVRLLGRHNGWNVCVLRVHFSRRCVVLPTSSCDQAAVYAPEAKIS